MSDHAPPGTPANDGERTRSPNPPGGGSLPPGDPDATIIPFAPPPPRPPLYGSAPPAAPVAPQPPPAPPGYPPANPTAPYPTPPPAYGGQGQPNPYADPHAPPPYGGGYPPAPPYGGTQPLPPQASAPPHGGYPGGSPPYAAGYGYPPSGAYPPTGAPPPKSKFGLALGIVGGVLALIAILAVTFAFVKKSDTGTATATPARATPVASAAISTTTAVALATQAGGGSILATISAAATGTASPAPVPTQAVPIITRAPSTTAATASASRAAASPTAGSARSSTPIATTVTLGQTWTDPNGFVRLRYPNGWTATKDASVKANVLELDGPDNTFFYLSIYDPQTSAVLNEEIADIRNVHAKDAQYTYTDGPVVDAQIGGEPARTFPYTAKNKTSGASFRGQVWEVNHSGIEYLLSANSSSAHQAEIDAIIASITFQK